MINNFIVTTTIFKPSVALKKFLNINNWQLIVVGDKKTPHNLYKEIKKIIYDIKDWNNTMNLYKYNCQHFSSKVKKILN